MPLANSFLRPEQLKAPENTYPLDLVFCSICSLVQITETVPPEQLFSNYAYLSSFSETMLKESKNLADRLIRERGLDTSSLVVELGSNDGYQLQYFVDKSIPVLGIDPAKNLAEIAESKGVKTICGFFGQDFAHQLNNKGIVADAIIAKNVLAHVADLNGFVEGMRTILKKSGTAVIEVPYIKELLDRREFDTIYHEHLCYFSMTALNNLFERHGMVLTHVERIPLHGGSLRLFVSNQGRPMESVRSLLREEKEWGADHVRSYLDFANSVAKVKDSIRSLLTSIKEDGGTIAAYGAAAKGTVLLNYCGIGADTLEFIVDLSPHKQGLYMPGVRVQICPPTRLLEAMPDYTLILAWNLTEEIITQQSEYLGRGGKFIIPLPHPRIVGGH